MPALRLQGLFPDLGDAGRLADAADDIEERLVARDVFDRRARRQNRTGTAVRLPKPRRPDGQQSFKCGRCRAFVGPTPSGGRHRNHCPLCLASRHVDARRPGDRASPCRSLMAAVGVFCRPKGEQVVLHRCLGCGLERHNRVAADDSPLALLRLPPVPPRLGGRRAVQEEATA